MNRLKNLVQYLFSFGLMALFLYWAFSGVDFEALESSAAEASPLWIGLIIVSTLVTLVVRAWRWLVLMRPFAPSVTVWDASIALAVCYTANLVVPRSGEALRAISLKWMRNTSIGSVMATVVVERIIDFFCVICLVGVSIFLLQTRVQQAFPWMEGAMLGSSAFCLLLLAILVLVSVYPERGQVIVHGVLGALSKRLATAVANVLEKFIQGLRASLHNPAAYVEIVVSSIILNIGYILIIYQAFRAFGFHHPPYELGASAALVLMAIPSLGFIAPTPGGTGSYHFLFSWSGHLLYALPQAAALACATVIHIISSLTYVAVGGPALIVHHLRRRRRQPKQQTTTLAQEPLG